MSSQFIEEKKIEDNWSTNPSLNFMFLRRAGIEATQKFNENGFLLWNDMCDIFNIPRTDLGNEVCWVRREED